MPFSAVFFCRLVAEAAHCDAFFGRFVDVPAGIRVPRTRNLPIVPSPGGSSAPETEGSCAGACKSPV